MTRDQYITKIISLYTAANYADTDKADGHEEAIWMRPSFAHTHCTAYEVILRDIAVDAEEYDSFINRVGE